MKSLDFSSIGSYECGENLQFSFCDRNSDEKCKFENGAKTVFDAELGSNINELILKYKDATNLNLASISEKSEALFKKLNLSPGDISN